MLLVLINKNFIIIMIMIIIIIIIIIIMIIINVVSSIHHSKLYQSYRFRLPRKPHLFFSYNLVFQWCKTIRSADFTGGN